jgi:hypothetical protein
VEGSQQGNAADRLRRPLIAKALGGFQVRQLMEKRYQVFVSSTYADLQEERRKVIQTLMEMDCIPSGMEIFPAADEEQWEFMKKVISDCDYYILIIGGRYGSVTPEGISYTEKEYDFAVSIGLKVIAFLHKNPEDIPAKNTELNPELRGKLESFRRRVSEGRLVKFWSNADELPGLVALSLSKTIKTYPAIGWVRADQVANIQILNEVNDLRKRNQELENLVSRIRTQSAPPPVNNLAGLTDSVKIFGDYHWGQDSRASWKHTLSWGELFALIAPYLLENPNDTRVKSILGKSVFEKTGKSGYSIYINDQNYQTVKVQLAALGLVNLNYSQTTKGGMALFWSLTPKGKELLFQLRTARNENAT